jgi:hypothetical protein
LPWLLGRNDDVKLNSSIKLGGLGKTMGANREKVKLIIAGACAVTAITSAVITFLSSGDETTEFGETAGAATWNGPVGIFDADYQHLVTIGKIVRANASGGYIVENLRDPMVAPEGALRAPAPAKTSTGKPAPTTLPPMWLSGIIWDPANPIAMINGLDLHVGDSVKGARVVEIRIDSVVLSFKSKHYVLTVD